MISFAFVVHTSIFVFGLANKNSTACVPNISDHRAHKDLFITFKPTEFRKSLTGRRYLMDDAVPSIFPWSAASQKRKSPRKRSQHPSSAAEMPFFGSVSEDSDFPASDEISDLRLHIAKLEEQIKFLQQENKHLLKNVDKLLESQFGITRFKDSDSDINFYTGFPNYETLLACYNFLNPGVNGENIVYVNSAIKQKI